jgi:hypothetical protein
VDTAANINSYVQKYKNTKTQYIGHRATYEEHTNIQDTKTRTSGIFMQAHAEE